MGLGVEGGSAALPRRGLNGITKVNTGNGSLKDKKTSTKETSTKRPQKKQQKNNKKNDSLSFRVCIDLNTSAAAGSEQSLAYRKSMEESNDETLIGGMNHLITNKVRVRG